MDAEPICVSFIGLKGPGSGSIISVLEGFCNATPLHEDSLNARFSEL